MKVSTVVGAHRKHRVFTGIAPLANLLSGAGVIFVWRMGWLGGPPTAPISLVILFGILSLITGFGSLVPSRTKDGLRSDGAWLWMIATDSREWRRWLCVTALTIQVFKGIDPKGWNQRWLRTACASNDGSIENHWCHWLAHLAAEAREDAAGSAEHLEVCLQRAGSEPEGFVDLMRAKASIFHSWHNRDAAKSEKWFSRIREPQSLPPMAQITTLVGLRLVQNRNDEALAKWDEGLKIIQSYPAGQREREEKSWMEWKAQILERCGSVGENTEAK